MRVSLDDSVKKMERMVEGVMEEFYEKMHKAKDR